jgi:tetratricopeptide (TPR) repeat protein
MSRIHPETPDSDHADRWLADVLLRQQPDEDEDEEEDDGNRKEDDEDEDTEDGYQLDPLSPIISVALGVILVSARRFDEAIAVCKKVADQNPTFAEAHRCLSYGYWGKRMYPLVIEEWKTFGHLSDDRNESEFASALEQGFRSAGWKGALTKSIEVRQAQRRNGYPSAYPIAALYADMGDKDQAFRWFNTAYKEREGFLIGLKTNNLFDPIRSDPRFGELVRKMGLPH